MKLSLGVGGAVFCVALGSLAAVPRAADQIEFGHHGRSNLSAAALDGSQVVPASPTTASGTAVLVVDPAGHSIRYDVTYRGLHGPASQVVLRNFGRGMNGKTVQTFCGGAAELLCPAEKAATLRGTIESHDAPILAEEAIKELALGRMYIEIEVDGAPEIRGQFDNRDLMLPVVQFVSRLESSGDERATGTAVFVLAPAGPDGSTRLNYLITVTDGRPEELILNPTAFATLRVPTKLAKAALDTEQGATLTGAVALPPAAKESFAAKLAEQPGPRRVTVTTDGGTLTGSLETVE